MLGGDRNRAASIRAQQEHPAVRDGVYGKVAVDVERGRGLCLLQREEAPLVSSWEEAMIFGVSV